MIAEILFNNDVVFLPCGLVVSPVKRQSTRVNWLLVGLIYQYPHMEMVYLKVSIVKSSTTMSLKVKLWMCSETVAFRLVPDGLLQIIIVFKIRCYVKVAM